MKMANFGIRAACLAAACAAWLAQPARVLADACCRNDGTCTTVASQAACDALNGCWQGFGTSCTGRYCPVVDDVATGACISSGGACLGVISQADCLCLNGAGLDDANLKYWLGAGTTCADVTNDSTFFTQAGPLGGTPGGQINISGATLFVPFFQAPASYNDFNNSDGDVIPCSNSPWSAFRDTNCDGNIDFITGDRIDPLGRSYACNTPWWGHWLVQYRSVGSVNGYSEFIEWQLTGALPTTIPTEEGLINGCRWALGGAKTGACSGCDAYCLVTAGTGDMNCDGRLDGLDIPGFVQRVFGTAACSAPDENGDFNGDTLVDEFDVPQFVQCLLTGGLGCYQGDNPGGLAGQTGTPVCPESIDIAFLDVPGKWGTVGPPGNPSFRRTPNQPGYGRSDVPSFSGFISNLAFLDRQITPNSAVLSLNFNQEDPDQNTLYDTPVAFVPVVPIATRGVGLENIRFTELQHLLVTGRMPNGENLVGTTRDVGSGTRNAYNNALGVDPSWGMGDNEGGVIFNENPDSRGPGAHLGYVLGGTISEFHYSNNSGSSSISERNTINRRLAIGYTGLFGNGRAISDALTGVYEIMNVCKDVDGDGDGNIDSDCSASPCYSAGGPNGCPAPPNDFAPANTGYVRPSIDSVIDNEDPRCSYTVGGFGSFVSRGDPLAGRPGHENNPPMANPRARNYLLNIIDSIAAFINDPSIPENQQTPGQFLATRFTLIPGLDAEQDQNFPMKFDPDFVEDQSLQDVIRCTTTQVTPAFGSISVANRVPQRVNQTSGFVTQPVPYSDGSTTGAYRNDAGAFSITGGSNLTLRNRVMGDFNVDGLRNWDDIPLMMLAVKNPNQFQADDVSGAVTVPPHAPGGSSTQYIIPAILGDFDGDGNFGDRVAASCLECVINGGGGNSVVGTIEFPYEMSDARYFADGLAIDPVSGDLNRKQGFIRVDDAWNVVTPGDINFFDTKLATAKVYAAGDSRGDVAGNDPHPGSNAVGADGCVDNQDIDYVFLNFIADWRDLDSTIDFIRNARIDLSCDMDGDLDVDNDDVTELVEVVLCTKRGDANLDGRVDAADDTTINANLGQAGGWAQGDFDGDGQVTASDRAYWIANNGFVSACSLAGPTCN